MHHAAFLAFFLFLYFSPFVSICCAIHLSIHSHTVHTISIEFELQCLMTCVASPGLSVPYKFSRHFLFGKIFAGFLTPTWRRWEVWRPCQGNRVERMLGRTGNHYRSRRSRCERSQKNRRRS